MNNLWLKVRIWTKSLFLGAVVLYILIFLYNNSNEVEIWYWFRRPPYTGATWYMLLGVFLAGAVVALLLRTAFRTLRQMRELKDRGQRQRIEKELAEMKAKASMLQTRGSGSTSSVTTSASPLEPRSDSSHQTEIL